jgi:hypothetical protein
MEVMFFRGVCKHRAASQGVTTIMMTGSGQPGRPKPRPGDPLDMAHFNRNFVPKVGVAPLIPKLSALRPRQSLYSDISVKRHSSCV